MTPNTSNANTSAMMQSILSSNTKSGSILQASLMFLTLFGAAYLLGFNKENRFDLLRDKNQLTNLEAFCMLFGQQLCALMAFTALEIREDRILPPRENMLRGIGTKWPRARVYKTIYREFPLNWAIGFACFMTVGGPVRIFSSYNHESWLTWSDKMVSWFVVWEFMMYSFNRIAHAVPFLYKWGHKDHHVVMDFPLGPHAPALEKLAHYTASIIASRIVGISVGSWVLALNILMTQCVLEHAYSSFTIPLWHSIFAFNTADLHQTHHVHNNSNFGYAFNIFDPLFGTLSNSFEDVPSSITGPASPARVRSIKFKARML